MQEMITLAVFVPFSIVYMKEAPKLDYLWAALCIGAARVFHSSFALIFFLQGRIFLSTSKTR
jgi:uncharacterized protein (DUF486 family)